MGQSLKYFLEGPQRKVLEVSLLGAHYEERAIIRRRSRRRKRVEEATPEYLKRTFVDQQGRVAEQINENGDTFRFREDEGLWHLRIG